METLVFFLTAILAHAANSQLDCSCGKENRNSRIFGGEVSKENVYPWMTYIRIGESNGEILRCAGAIINDRFVLTAANCLFTARKVDIFVGKNTVKHNFYGFHEAQSWKNHEQYTNEPPFKNDIALIETKKPLQFSSKVRPICLPKRGERAAGTFTVAGWGVTENGDTSDNLYQVNVTEYDFNECNRALDKKLISSQICAAYCNTGPCHGDFGGPLMQRKSGEMVAAGIVSFALGKTCGIRETVHTRVESYLDWILKNSASGKNCTS